MILGANGAGKTTTLRAICGMVARARAASRFDGTELDRPRARADRARAGIAHVPQGRGTFADADRRGEPAARRLRAQGRRRGREDIERCYGCSRAWGSAAPSTRAR